MKLCTFKLKLTGLPATRKSTFMKLIRKLGKEHFDCKRIGEHEWEITWKEVP